MKILKKLLVLFVAAVVLGMCIVHPFKEVDSVHTGNDAHQIMRPIGVNESITQHFRATDNNLIQLEFVVDFDERYPKEGQLHFELIDAKGNILFEEMLDYGTMPDYKYNGPIINVRLKKGREYAYRITNVNITENMPCGVYTVDPDMCRLKKGKIEFAGETIEGELLTQITANKPLKTDNTMAICGSVGMVGFLLYEILTGIEKKRNNAQKNGEKKSV